MANPEYMGYPLNTGYPMPMGDLPPQEEMLPPNLAPFMAAQQQVGQAALVAQTDPKHVIKEIEHQLRSEVEKPDKTGWEKVGEPMLNDKGITDLLLDIKSVVNQNTILSFLTEDEINKIIQEIGNKIVDKLTLNCKEYGIADRSKLDSIVDACLYPTYFALKRALKQSEKNWLHRTVFESIQSRPSPQELFRQREKGFFSRLGFGGR